MPREKQLSFVSPGGLEWDALALLAAVRWSLRLLWFVLEGGDLRNPSQLDDRGLEVDIVKRVIDGVFWPEVRRVAAMGEDPSGLETRLNCSFPDEGVCGPLPDLLASWQRAADPDPASRRTFILGFIRAIVAVSALATSLPGEGLGRFSDRFRQMGKAQQAVFGPRSGSSSVSAWKRSFLVDTIAEIAPTTQVAAAEFRRTFKASEQSAFRRELLHELAIHNSAFAEFSKRAHSMSLTMPVGFGRRGSSQGGACGGIEELQHVLAGCDALISIYEEDRGEELMQAIWSIDVAGLEIGSSNWPFQIGAQLLERAGVGLVFTIHAGESFTSELNGVRRVGELFVGPTAPRRIGHALALSADTADRVLGRGRPPISRLEAIMDLAWLNLAIGSQDALNALEILSPRQLPQPGIDAETWVRAFEALHHGDEVYEILIGTAGHQRKVRSRKELDEGAEAGEPLERAIGALAWGAPAEIVGCEISAPLAPHEDAAYLAVVATETPAARKHVLDLIKAKDVTIESCPTSNVTLAGLSDYGAHPFWEWSKPPYSVDVSISSDDPLHFRNNVLGEVSALLATGRDRQSLRSAVETGLRDCSGGSAKRVAGRRGYARVVDLIEDSLVRN